MVDLNMLLTDLIAWDTGFWGTLIGWFNSFITSYGWTIILFTLVVKLILSPLDYLQRKVGFNNAMAQAKMQPELNKIKEKYAHDPEKMRAKLNEKQAQMMRNGDMKLGSTCTIMLLYLVITLVVFVSLFYSMQAIGNIKTVNSYIELENEYEAVLQETNDQTKAQEAVLELYNSGTVTESWLWISNIWKPDTSTSVVSNFNEFKTVSQAVAESPYKFEGEGALTEEKYNTVMAKITESTAGRWNGYYILIILCGLLSFLSFYVTALTSGNKNAQAEAGGFAKIMKFIMPAIMVLITLFYSSAFALYIFASSLFSVITTPLFNTIFRKKKEKLQLSGGNANGNGNTEIDCDYRINKITRIDE